MFNERLHLLVAILILTVILGIGTTFYHYEEGWSLIDSFYFSTITLTTIGYGDLAPKTDVGKLFTAFYAIFGIGILLYVMRYVIGSFLFKRGRDVERLIFNHHKLNQQDKEMDKQRLMIRKDEKEIKKQGTGLRKTRKK
jgi:hypothetical protein